MTFLNVITWIEMIEFRLNFHWGLFLMVHLTRSQLWSGSWIGVVWRQAVIWTNDDPVQWRIYVSPDLNELKYIWSLPGHRLEDAVFVYIYWTRIVCKFHRFCYRWSNWELILVQVFAWCRLRGNPLPVPMLAYSCDAMWHHQVTVSTSRWTRCGTLEVSPLVFRMYEVN